MVALVQTYTLHVHDPKAYQEQIDTQMNNLVGKHYFFPLKNLVWGDTIFFPLLQRENLVWENTVFFPFITEKKILK